MAGFEHHLWVCVSLEDVALSPAPSKAKIPSYSIPHPLSSTSHYTSMPKTFPLSFVHLFSHHTALCGLESSRGFVPGAISASHCLGMQCGGQTQPACMAMLTLVSSLFCRCS